MHPAQLQVRDFHRKFGMAAPVQPTMPDAETRLLRARLIQEEAAEFTAAVATQNMAETADAIADLLYVVYGAAVTLGIDIAPIFDNVHYSNMTKTGGTDTGGKITKGPHFIPPDPRGYLAAQGWGND